MFHVIVLKTEVNEDFVLTVRGNIPDIDPAFPDVPIEERIPPELLKDTVKSKVEIPIGWLYAGGKFIEPPEPPEPEFEPWERLQEINIRLLELRDMEYLESLAPDGMRGAPVESFGAAAHSELSNERQQLVLERIGLLEMIGGQMKGG